MQKHNTTWLKQRIIAKLNLPFSIRNSIEFNINDEIVTISIKQPADLVEFDKKHQEIKELEKELDIGIEVIGNEEWKIF